MRTSFIVIAFGILGAAAGAGRAFFEIGSPASDASFVTADVRQPEMPNPGDEPPEVVVDVESYDFGVMERETTTSHEFIFTNAGQGKLKLTVGETTCKCTVGHVSDGWIEPGKSTPVRLEWTAKTNAPEFRQSATILTNDPNRKRVSLSVFGRVSEPTSVTPPLLHFDKVTFGERKTVEVHVLSHYETDFHIVGHEFVGIPEPEHFIVEIERVEQSQLPDPLAKSGYLVRVTMDESIPFGVVNGWLRLSTDLEKVEQIDIPLTARVVSDVSIFGRGYHDSTGVLRLGAIKSGEGKKAKLQIILKGDATDNVAVHVAETSPKYLIAELGEPIRHSVVQIPLSIEIPAGTAPVAFVGGKQGTYGRIVLETTHPKIPRVEIRVQFTVE